MVEFHGVQQHAFSPDIWDIDDQARRRRTDVNMMGGIGRETYKLAGNKHGHHNRNIRRVRGTFVWVIMDHTVAWLPVFDL